MFSYIVGLLAVLVVFYNPISKLVSPSHSISRSSRPQLNESLLAIDSPNQTVVDCPADAYSVHILSKEPLVIYIENFLSLEDRSHLVDISKPLFEPSTVTNDGDSTHRDTTVRESEVALIPRTETVRCIEARARALQGWKDELWIERLRTQRYVAGGHYSHHFDWSSNIGGWGRVSSFMVWVDADNDIEGGGTEFPMLSFKGDGKRWCRLLECDGGSNETNAELDGPVDGPAGVVFRPMPGNAVFWENFRADGSGRGYEETWHAGLPVTRGVKIGLNIWSWGKID